MDFDKSKGNRYVWQHNVKADEYALEEATACNYGESSKHVYQGYFYGFKKGAEFGYNKAKEEMQEQGLALQSDMDKTIEQNIALKEQIEKMKCCENCAKNGHICVAEEMQGKLCGKNKVKWQLRR